MKKSDAFLMSVVLSGILAVGCSSESPERKAIIPDIDIGMTSEEVFDVMGRDYDHSAEIATYKNTAEYDYILNEDEVFGTGLKGYLFFEFDSQTDKLVTYGYHLGVQGDLQTPVYPYSEEELKSAYSKITGTLIEWYGDGEQKEPDEENGIRDEYIWHVDDKQLWAVYGVNLWAWSEPESYEKGINEIIVSWDHKITD